MKARRQYDVLVAGDYTIDLIFTGLPALPRPGEDSFASGFDTLPGEAYTPAVAMHRLGLSVGWAGDFGNDAYSRLALQFAQEEGLDQSLFEHHDRPYRRVSVAAVLPQDRAFITFYDPDPKIPAILKALPRANAAVFYLPGLYNGPWLDAGLRLVRAKKMKLVMDGNSGSDVSLANPAISRAIRCTDVFLPNAREARTLTGQEDLSQAALVLGELCPLVVIKNGADGALACQDGRIVTSPALPVAPLDTTGAGDCFNAGFLKAWLDGLSLMECLRWGNVVGGLSTLARGGTGQVTRATDVHSYLKKLPLTS